MRFDAYAGNVWNGVTASELAQVVAVGLNSGVERGRSRGRYSDVFELRNLPSDGSGWVGRDETLETAYFEFKGAVTPAAVSEVRRHWPDTHSVARFDSCQDVDGVGAFAEIVRIVDAARDPRVQSHSITPRDGDRGETVYWGTSQSRVMVRCYEAGKMKDRLHFGRPNWARAEAQVRPGKAAEKKLAASLSPLDAWGLAAWSRRAAELLTGSEVPRFAPESSPPEFDRTTLYLARTFQRHWAQMLLDFGSWECIGRELEAVWEADRVAAEKMEALTRRSV